MNRTVFISFIVLSDYGILIKPRHLSIFTWLWLWLLLDGIDLAQAFSPIVTHMSVAWSVVCLLFLIFVYCTVLKASNHEHLITNWCCHLANRNDERFRVVPNYFGACSYCCYDIIIIIIIEPFVTGFTVSSDDVEARGAPWCPGSGTCEWRLRHETSAITSQWRQHANSIQRSTTRSVNDPLFNLYVIHAKIAHAVSSTEKWSLCNNFASQLSLSSL